MATVRIQVRRGTSADWSNVNPILAAGEMGVETDTRKIKVGDGSTAWNSLDYIASDAPGITEIAQDAIDSALVAGTGLTKTYNDGSDTITIEIDTDVIATQTYVDDAVAGLSGSVSEGYIPVSDMGIAGGVATLDSGGKIPVGQIDDSTWAKDSELTAHNNATTSVHGIANTAMLATKAYADAAVSTHEADTTNVHGIADTAELATKSYVDTAAANAVAGVIDAAPDSLNTLNELAAALGDDANYASTITTSLSGKLAKSGDTMSGELDMDGNKIVGIADPENAQDAATKAYADYLQSQDLYALEAHKNTTTSVHGIADVAELSTKTYVNDHIDTHNAVTTNVHGILDTAALATTAYVDSQDSGLTDLITDKEATLNSAIEDSLVDAKAYTDTKDGATRTYIDDAISDEEIARNEAISAEETARNTAVSGVQSNLTTHTSATTSVHGIADTAALATKTYADSAVSTHSSDTTDVHGIADTAALATKSGTETLTNKTINLTSNTLTGTKAQFNSAMSDADFATLEGTETLTNKTLTSPTINSPSGLAKADVGLGNVDNTSDANKPVSTATQTALDLKANLAGPTFTGTTTAAALTVTGNLTVQGTTTTVSATNMEITDPLIYIATGNAGNSNDIGIVGHATVSGTYQHMGLARDHSDGKWKLFSGVTTEPTNTLAFGEATFDALKIGALEATTVTPASGVVFTDGTQTKEGVASRTPIIQKTASYTLSALTERDSLIEVASSSGTTVTIPANSAVAYPVGTSIDILQTSTGQVTIAGAAGVTVNATPGLKLRTQWSSATLFKRATDTWVVMGDLSA
jgi:hypothetical protein